MVSNYLSAAARVGWVEGLGNDQFRGLSRPIRFTGPTLLSQRLQAHLRNENLQRINSRNHGHTARASLPYNRESPRISRGEGRRGRHFRKDARGYQSREYCSMENL